MLNNPGKKKQPQTEQRPPAGRGDGEAGTACEAEKRRRDERRRRYREAWQRLNRQERRVWTPWMVIRYGLTDLGLRPIPSGTPHWQSPDIWVESSDPSGRAVAGEENFIHARLFNLGKADAVPVRVDYYWADPSLGLGPANMNLIGTEWTEVGAHTARDVRCNTPWVPTFLNNGHECLMVNCSALILDPITQPFQPRLDRHVGQRNITVIQGTASATIDFVLMLNNLLPILARSQITARIEHVAAAPALQKTLAFPELVNHVVAFGGAATGTAEELRSRFKGGLPEDRQARRAAAFLAARKQAGVPAGEGLTAMARYSRSSACVGFTQSEQACIVKSGDATGQMGQLLLATEKLNAFAQPADFTREIVVQELVLQAAERRQVTFHLGVPGNARPGEFVVFHLAQRAEGLLMGGYTVVVHIVPGVARAR